MSLNKKNKKNKKQSGGDNTNNVISASVDLVKSMKELGSSIFNEMISITRIGDDINNAASPSPGTPNVINGPPTFNPPSYSDTNSPSPPLDSNSNSSSKPSPVPVPISVPKIHIPKPHISKPHIKHHH
jgi:hypothetical protein